MKSFFARLFDVLVVLAAAVVAVGSPLAWAVAWDWQQSVQAAPAVEPVKCELPPLPDEIPAELPARGGRPLTSVFAEFGRWVGEPFPAFGSSPAVIVHESTDDNWALVYCRDENRDVVLETGLLALHQRYAPLGVRFLTIQSSADRPTDRGEKDEASATHADATSETGASETGASKAPSLDSEVGIVESPDTGAAQSSDSEPSLPWPRAWVGKGEAVTDATPESNSLAERLTDANLPAVFLLDPSGTVVEAGMTEANSIDFRIRHHLTSPDENE